MIKKLICVFIAFFLLTILVFCRCSCFIGPPVYSTPTVIPVSGPSNSRMGRNNYSSPVQSQPLTRNKRSSEVVAEAPTAAKKTRSRSTSTKLATQGMFSSFLYPIISWLDTSVTSLTCLLQEQGSCQSLIM